MGARHGDARSPGRPPGSDCLPRRRRGGGTVARYRGPQAADLPPRREGQLLGHGSDRSVRPVQRDPPLPRACRGERLPDRRPRTPVLRVERHRGQRFLDGDLEPRLHAVRAQGARGPARAAAEAFHRYRRGARARRSRRAERRLQLRYGSAAAAHQGSDADQREAVFGRRGRRCPRRFRLDARGRRSCPGGRLPHRGRRAPFERRPGLRPAADPAPRDPPRPAAERRSDALRERVRQGHRDHVRRVPGARRFARSHPGNGAARD